MDCGVEEKIVLDFLGVIPLHLLVKSDKTETTEGEMDDTGTAGGEVDDT